MWLYLLGRVCEYTEIVIPCSCILSIFTQSRHCYPFDLNQTAKKNQM